MTSAGREADQESLASFQSGPISAKPTIRYAWSGNGQVDHDTYHRMVEEYRAAKQKEGKDELKIKQLAAQLARTEEAAKRALVRSDQGARGSTAQQLLDAQRQRQQLQAENSELSSKLAREKKRSSDYRAAAEEHRRRLEAALREQRSLVRKLGEAERSLGGSAAARSAARKAAAEQEYWSEEAGRRFAVQQEELVALREQNAALQQHMAAAVPADTAARYEASIKELQQLVHFYEQRLMAAGGAAAVGMDSLGAAGAPAAGQDAEGCCGSWLLETLCEGGACYLWERSSGRVMTDVPDGHWPRPVGCKASATSSIQLGCKGRLDAAFRALADALGQGQQQAVQLEQFEAAARDLLSARDAVRQGRDLAVNEALLSVRRLLRQEPRAVAAAFEQAAGQDGCLGAMQVVELLQQQHLMPDLSPREGQYLLVLLHEWDVTGSTRHSLTDVYAALQLLKLAKEAYLSERVAALEAELAHAKSSTGTVSSQQVEALRGEVARYQSRLAELENDFLSLDVVASTEVDNYDAEMRKAWFTAAAFKKRYVEHKLELDAVKATAEKMQKALDDTHSALHAEAARRMSLEEAAAVAKLEAARTKELAAAVAAERAERLKLEKDYLELQSKAFAAPGSALAEVRSLREELLAARRERAMTEAREAELRREIASLKRQMEGVSPEEHRRLVRELGEAKMRLVSCELELRAALDKLEVYRRADHAAAAAAAEGAASGAAGYAGSSLTKSLQPDESKSEAELRLELAQLRQAMALEAGELDKVRKLLDTEATISLEAKAALEEAQCALAAAKSDAMQQLAKLRRELDSRDERIRKLEAQLRGAYSGLSRAAVRASMAAPSGGDGAGVRVSRVGLGAMAAGAHTSLEDVSAGLGPHENVIEVVVTEAVLSAGAFPADASTFVVWDFFLHDSQATPQAPGTTPTYNTTVQYVVEADSFLLDYLVQQQLELELFEARGLDAVAVGAARLPLQLLLQDLEVGAALGGHRSWHHLDIVGSAGQQLGRLRVGLRVAKPMDKLLLQYKSTQSQQQEHEAAAAAQSIPADTQVVGGDINSVQQVLQQAAAQADAEPSKASFLLVSIHSCQSLVVRQQQQQAGSIDAQCPYAHYTPPGRDIGHDTAVARGPAPVFGDAASWGLLKCAAVEQALRQEQLQVAVFDDAVAGPAALIGVATVPLASLAEGIPVEGTFCLTNPVAAQPAGTIQISHILLAHMFCEDYTSAADQCTSTIAKRQGVLAFNYCVAYTVANPITLEPTPAGKALAQALAAADAGQTPRTVLPVLLASSRAPVVSDFSQVDCVATCEADLTAIWQGETGDILSQDFKLAPSADRAMNYPLGYTGTLTLTLVAAKAIANLKQHHNS
ncbi:hypothetical protein OEZ85_007032 [Tetradesmus obliquus]|uniref:C2 domain-containing protein n=1 Tax=Tetradesmus obliquus TaxID=3088 RepID=A0ABY8TWT6_TETOB|nr:hypothetical protein OEZ85_007032 [Tetradesmus obliquus]